MVLGARRAILRAVTTGPEIAVCVASHERPLRLRWLLNALEEQTLDPARFEVCVCDDSRGEETARLLAEHPLACAGVLRHERLAPGTGTAARQRNVAWRMARAPLVAFTDDDCRPPPDWLEHALAAARRHPGAIVQGAVRPDPDELAVKLHSPHPRTVEVDPPVPWAQTANILYPRDLLERVGGFDEASGIVACEDTELAARCVATGAEYAGAPEVLTFHAVEAAGLRARMRDMGRWRELAYVVRRHPSLRRHLILRLFWKPSHLWALPALAGLVVAGRRPLLAAALVAPWALSVRPRYGNGPRGLARSLSELPGRALIEAAELAAVLRGAVRHRTPLI
jgi:GT2 family glycosyltransferase